MSEQDPTDGAAVEGAPAEEPIADEIEILEPEALDTEAQEADEVEVIEMPQLTADHLGIELPDDRADAEAVLVTEIAIARQAAGEYLDQLQRTAAEFDNFRRRAERDLKDSSVRATQRIVDSMLPTLDAFDAALAYTPQSPGEESLLGGMQGTHSQLMETLAREGLEVIAAMGEPFDPAFHEAVSGGGDGDLVVSQVLRSGYRIGDRVVRPSLVVVAASDGG